MIARLIDAGLIVIVIVIGPATFSHAIDAVITRRISSSSVGFDGFA